MTRSTPLFRAALALLCAAVAGACTEDARSPVGIGVVPGGVFEDGLESVVSTGFSRAIDYDVFPSRRADGDRLAAAHDWPAAPGFESRPIFRFVVATSDTALQNAELLDATLRLVYALDDAPGVATTYSVHRVTAAWSEDAATWERRTLGASWGTPGGDFDPDPVATFTIEPAAAEPDSAIQADSLTVEIPADLVRGWRDGTIENHGLILIQETPGEAIEFASRGGGGGFNSNGPSLLVNERLPGEAGAIQLRTILAVEDTFLPHDDAPLASDPGLLLAAGDPSRRIFLEPTLADVPEGATVARARLVMTIAAARVPIDTFRITALEAESEFLGEKTVYDPIAGSTVLSIAVLTPDAAPGDSVVFEGSRLTRLIRLWLRSPESNQGFGLVPLEEGTDVGAVRFHGPEAAAELRPRLELLVLPPPEEGGG